MSGAHLAARPLRRHAHCPPGPSQRRCWAGLGCWSAHLPPALTGRACATRSRRYSRVWRRRRWRKQGSGGQGRVLAWTWAAAVLVVPPRTHPRCRAPMAAPRKTRAGKSIQRSKRAADQAQHRCDVVQRNAVGAMGTVGGLHPAKVPADGAGVQGSGGGGGEAKEIRRSHTPVGPAAHRPPEEFAPGHSAQKGHPSTGEAATQAVGQLLRQCLDSATGARAGPAQVLDHDLEPNCGKQRKGKRKITRKTRCCCRWQVRGNERSRHCDFFSSLE